MATYTGKYSGLAQGLGSGFKVGSGIGEGANKRREAENKKAEEAQLKDMRRTAVDGGYSSDEMKDLFVENPEAATKLMEGLDSMNEFEQGLAQVELDNAGKLYGFVANADSPEEFARRHQIVTEEIQNGSMPDEFAKRFPSLEDPDARAKIMMGVARMAEIDQVMDLYFKKKEKEIDTRAAKDEDDHKTKNQLRKEREEHRLSRSMETLKQGNKIGLENLKHGNTTDRLKLQGKDNDNPKPADVNKLVRNVSKKYEKKVAGKDDFGEEITETRSPAEIRKFQRAMKKNIDAGMGEFEAETKAAEEVFGEGGGSSAVGGSPAFRYNPESGKLEAVQ